MRREVRKMALRVDDVDLASAIDAALHVVDDCGGHDDVVSGLDDVARHHDFVEHISVVGEEHSFGEGKSCLWPHFLQRNCEFLDGEWVGGIHHHRSKRRGPLLVFRINA